LYFIQYLTHSFTEISKHSYRLDHHVAVMII